MKYAMVAERDVFADDAIGADFAAWSDVRFRMNNGS
jgi:hypothetical protein